MAAAWSYNARLKATAASWVPYALAFGAVPSIVVLALPDGGVAPWWATAAGALLGVGAHLCNALPDLEEDLARGRPRAAAPARTGAVGRARRPCCCSTAVVLLALGPPGGAGAGRGPRRRAVRRR